MATYNDNLVTNFLIGTDQLSSRLEKMKTGVSSFQQQLSKAKGLTKLNYDLSKVGVKMNNAGRIVDLTTGSFVKQSEVVKKLANQELRGLIEKESMAAKKAKEMKNRFDMNTLSWMFGGMALQRMGLMMTRFMIPSMDKLAKLNTYGAKQVMAVSAAFEFLKISLFETLSQTPLFGKFVEWIVKAAIWTSEFAQSSPLIVQMAAAIGGIATVLGTLAIGIGIFKQLAHLDKLIFNYFGMDGEGGTAGKSLKGFSKLAGALAIAFAVKGIWDDLKEGNFAPGSAIMNAGMMALGTKMFGASTKVALKAGVWTFIALIAIEMVLDPRGFGTFLADFANYTLLIAEKAVEYIKAMNQTIKDAVHGLFSMDNFKDIDNSGLGEQMYQGMQDRVIELHKQGKLAQTLEYAWGDQILQEAIPRINKAQEATQNFSTAFIKGFGSEDDENSIIGKTSLLGTGFEVDKTKFNSLKTDVETWASTETVKTVRINYVYSGGGGSSSGIGHDSLGQPMSTAFAGGD